MAYVFAGSADFGPDARRVADGDLALLGEGGFVRFAVPEDAAATAQFLLLSGMPLNEPVARQGPFVMNTAGEIRQAFIDYQEGRMGQIGE